MRGLAKWVALAAVTSAACTTGHEPNGCDSDLQIAVDGGATVRFRWDSDCVNASPSAPYRERPSHLDVPLPVGSRTGGPAIAEQVE
jgi:hypothetical protein